MKKIALLILALINVTAVNAQMAKWIMQPAYDTIYVATGAPLLLSDSLQTRTIWSLEGKRLSTTSDILHPFINGYAITSQPKKPIITGFYDTTGKFTPLNGYALAYPKSHFSEGLLLVRKNDSYRFIRTSGEEADFGELVKPYPFNNGYAAVLTYESIEKKKNPYYVYITPDNRPVEFVYNNKRINATDVEFLSTLTDNGTGIVIIKHKVYYFVKDTNSLEPIFADPNEDSHKKQVSVEGNVDEFLTRSENAYVINAKSGKNDTVSFVLDRTLKPVEIHFPGRTESFDESKPETATFPYHLSPGNKDGNKYGLKLDGTEVLPPQFDEVGLCFNNFAIVRKSDKWGMLTFDKDIQFKFIMHEGKDIAFRHKDLATTVKLELPSSISADRCRFDIGKQYGCTIDKISLETKNTENGNYVQYKCILSIPDSLPDVLTEIKYPVEISYDGIKHPIVPIKSNAWHYKYINVDLDESETTLEQGNVSFTINITADKQPGENDYPFEIDIKTDSLQTELIKISETRYKCKLYNLAEGINNVNISILESGCPPSAFPFEITYVKPAKRTRNKPEVKEAVTIQKKVDKVTPPKSEAPILPI